MSDLIFSGQHLPSQHLARFDELLRLATTPTVKPRPYTARVTRSCPTAFVFLLDQSDSMNNSITVGGQTMTCAEFLARTVNGLLNELITECRREGEYRNYIDLCVIGYGGDADSTACYAWQGQLAGRSMVTIEDLKDHPLDREGTKRVWLHPCARRLTPMKQAIDLARDTLVPWLAGHAGKDIYPPVVINITDGAATDATDNELIDAARHLKALRTPDGAVLFYNVHLSGRSDATLLFPCQPDQLPDSNYARTLFAMSSDLPAIYNQEIAHMTGRDARPAYTAMAFNASPLELVQFLNIGTSVSRRKQA